MSRCFPYPPPGYEKRPALIESIKLQKEREKAKKERKKEKKREKKEKTRGDDGKKEDERHRHDKRQYEEVSQPNPKAGHYIKTREDEGAQLERSSLTEEQGPAAVLNLCDSPDSTQNSSKRQQRREPTELRHKPHGSGLRIRLPLLRHRDSERPSSSLQPCFSGRIETVPDLPETRVVGRKESASTTEQPCFSRRTDYAPSEELAKTIPDGKDSQVEPRRVRRSHRCCDSDLRRQYKKLIVNWSPPPLQMENLELDDQDWLFGKAARRPRHEQGGRTSDLVASKESDVGNTLCSWPSRACYMPEVGICALPYVVPF